MNSFSFRFMFLKNIKCNKSLKEKYKVSVSETLGCCEATPFKYESFGI